MTKRAMGVDGGGCHSTVGVLALGTRACSRPTTFSKDAQILVEYPLAVPIREPILNDWCGVDLLMKQWFPFTDYDFYAYLTAGMLLIAAVDYTYGGAELASRTNWTVVQISFWTAVAYLTGQLIAAPSAAVLEHLLARCVFAPPITILLGLRKPRWHERLLAALFAGRDYAPLPLLIRERIFAKVAMALECERDKLDNAEAVFQVAYPVARCSTDAAARMDQFRNLYGFSRNLSFVGMIAFLLFALRVHVLAWSEAIILMIGAFVLAIGMFGRFVKFYAAFGAEVLRTYNAKQTADKNEG